ncbi:MAG TPA: uroporphyrinogen decarboxylase family protein [Planctomycetota bacterium]|nr:uroporphyrinogen decarboxylase family protein [Planctomycetota bacterium]HUV38821.1 uroporphyrinogen decarboxylase family protein [Planctomycetota bacterium]
MTRPTMTVRERLLAAMRCEPTDRVPIQVRGVYPTRPPENLHPSYRPLYDLVVEKCDPVHPVGFRLGWHGIDREALDRRVDEVPVDADWVEDVVTLGTPRGPLTEVHRRSLKGEPGFQTKHAVESVEDLERFLSIPAVAPEVDASAFHAATREVGERALVIADVGGNPISGACGLLGSELLAIWSVTERDRVKELVLELRARWAACVERLLDAGVGPVMGTLGHEVALPPLLAPADFRELVVDVDLPVMRMIRERGNLIHVHCHYNLAKVLDGFLELGVNCMHPFEAPPMGDLELVEAKRRVAGRICIEGNLQIGELQMATPERIRELTRQIIEDAAAGGGLILSPTASPYWPRLTDTVRDNYVAFIQTGREFGGYA